MATRTIANGGGNFSSTGTWVEGAVPIAGDAIVATGTSGQLTFDGSTGRAAASMDLTGYTNTLTLSGAMALTLTGNLTLATGMNTISGSTSTITFTAGVTITPNGKTWPGKIIMNSGGTFTLAGDFTVGNTLTLTASPIINSNNLIATGGLVISAGSNVTGTAGIKLTTNSQTFTVSTGSFTNNVTIDASGQTITMSPAAATFNYKTGTLTLVAGTVDWTTNGIPLNIAGDATLNWTQTIPNLQFTVASTLTLNAVATFGTITLPNLAVGFAGSFGWITATLVLPGTYASRTVTLQSSNVYQVSTALDNNNKNGVSVVSSLVASTPGTKAIFTLLNGATQNLSWWNPTDIDSSLGQPIFSYRGVITTCYNWGNTFPPVRRRPQVSLGA